MDARSDGAHETYDPINPETLDRHLDILRGNLTMTKFKEDPANVLDYGCGTGIWNLVYALTWYNFNWAVI